MTCLLRVRAVPIFWTKRACDFRDHRSPDDPKIRSDQNPHRRCPRDVNPRGALLAGETI
jgi:hypothetical protein